MFTWIKKLFKKQRYSRALGSADAARVAGKLREALGTRGQALRLFRITLQDGSEHVMVRVEVEARQVFFDKPLTGRVGGMRTLRFSGPVDRGGFIMDNTTLDVKAVRNFLRFEYGHVPEHRWSIEHDAAEGVSGTLWGEVDECFADALLCAKRQGDFALIANTGASSHAAAVRRTQAGYEITDFARANGRVSRARSLDKLAQEVLPLDVVTSAFIIYTEKN